jgi:predicted DNA-binding transcriptional regulator YafY
MAGIPIYSRQGRNGGWQLLGGARTDLSGLTAAEARALFLVAGPSSGATPEVKAALRKLVRALPEPFREAAEAASSAVVVDPTRWGSSRSTRPVPPHLDALQQAVIDGEQVVLGYVARDQAATTRVVHPLGLASKGNVWYLVADTETGQRTFRIDRVTSVEGTGDPVVRPEGFDLAEAWDAVTQEVDRQSIKVRARGTAAPDAVPVLRMLFGPRVRIGPAGADGRVEVDVGGWNERALAGEIAGLGDWVHVTQPDSIREHLAALGSQLVTTYGSANAGS